MLKRDAASLTYFSARRFYRRKEDYNRHFDYMLLKYAAKVYFFAKLHKNLTFFCIIS